MSDLQEIAVGLRDRLMERGVAAATVALPQAAAAVTGRVDGTPGGPRVGVLFHHDRPEGREAIAGLLGALEDVEPAGTLVFLSEGEREIGSPSLAGYLDTLADRLAAGVWVVAGGSPPTVVNGAVPDEGPVARVLEALSTAAGREVAASLVPHFIGTRLGCPVVVLPDADRGRWTRFFAALLRAQPLP
jgi:hypothetical protein